MSHENVERIQEAVRALNRDHQDATFDWVHPDVEWQTLDAFPDAGVHRGPEGVRDFFRAWSNAFSGFRVHLEECVPVDDVDDDRLIATLRVSGKGAESGAGVQSPSFFQLLEFQEGQLVRARMFQTKTEALEAAGLSE